MAGGGASNPGGGQMASQPPNPFQYSPQGNLTGMYGSQGNISGSDINNLVQRNMGHFGYTVNALNQAGIGQPDVARMAGIQPEGVYTYMNRPSQYTDQFFQPIYQPQYQSYSASPFSTFGVASYGTSPMMSQDIMSRGMQTVPYYSFGGGNLDMFGLPSVMTPFTYNPQRTGLGQGFSLRDPVAPGPGPGPGPGINPPGGGDPGTVPPPGGGGGGMDDGMVQPFGGSNLRASSGAGPNLQTMGAAQLPPETRAALSAMAATATDTPEYRSFAARAQQMGYTPQHQQMALQPLSTSYPQYQQQPEFGSGMSVAPHQPVVSRSGQVRGRPNVMMRRAEGGIADLLSK